MLNYSSVYLSTAGLVITVKRERGDAKSHPRVICTKLTETIFIKHHPGRGTKLITKLDSMAESSI